MSILFVMKEVIKNRFEKKKKLGEGSFGEVHKVFDSKSQCFQALKRIKFLPDDEGIPVNAIR